MKKSLLAIAMAVFAIGASAQTHHNQYRGMRPRAEQAHVADQITRKIETDVRGRKWIVTTTKTCDDARFNSRGQAVCYDWDTHVTREQVRRQRRSASMDLDGDGRTNGWERILFQSFRRTLDK